MKRSDLLAGAGAVALTGSAARASAQSPTKIRYGIAPVEDAALGPFALAKGFFSAVGLDVELTVLPSGGAITPALLGGTLDLGVTNIGSLALAHASSVPLFMVAGGDIYTKVSPSARVCAAKGGTIKSARDLPGKTVAVSTLKELQHCAVLQWLDQSGVDSKTVSFVQMGVGAMGAALQSGHLDAANLIEPFYSRSKDDVVELGQPFGAVNNGGPIQIFVTVATKSYIDANPDVVKRATAALRRAARWANDPRNAREAADIIASFSKVDVATVNAYPRMRFSEGIDRSIIQPSIDMMAKYRFLQRPFAASELIAPPSVVS